MTTDHRSVAGKRLQIAEETQVLVVGAGPAGIAAARAAHEGGARVVLIDEHPVPAETMGESIPQIWGGRMGGQVRNRSEMMMQILEARPALAELFEAGVDLRLGTACWGLYVNQTNLGWMPGPVAALTDENGTGLLMRADQIIVATGRRDMGLAFPGWDQPGVMGVGAAQVLARDYAALDARRVVLLGSTDDSLLALRDLIACGIEVVAVIEQAATPAAAPALVAELQAAGVEFRLNAAPLGVQHDTSGVTGLRLRDGDLACDTVLLGVGAVPMIDLIQAAGAACRFDETRGGMVPVLGQGAECSLAAIRAVGDCAGIWPAKSTDASVAEAEGRIAAAAALAALGLGPASAEHLPAPDSPAPDLSAYRKDWLRVAVIEALEEMPVCLCEEVTARDILNANAPRYLNAPEVDRGNQSLSEILGSRPPHPDQIKRITRAGMGPCQGRRCREQVQALVALREGLDLGAVPLTGYRSPVRPIPLSTAAMMPEDSAIAENWDPWFGIPGQWAPWQQHASKFTIATRSTEETHANE